MSIKQRRMAKGWTQEDLSLHSGLSTRTIQRVERGEKVGAETLKCLAAVFEESTSTLQKELMMTEHIENKSNDLPLTQLEKKALEQVKELIHDNDSTQLLSIERKAIKHAKNLLSKLKRS